ncbi:iron transporter [Steroidobacter flavus]|uniref:Iron transporter n=1 Tax=Steroidobacter flavus TaxID=1842136 RepID=A0ABV8T021_9GAMM
MLSAFRAIDEVVIDKSLRLLAASIGAYAITYLTTGIATLLLPLSRAEAAIVATNCSFLLLTVLAFWSFSCASIVRWWIAMALLAALEWPLLEWLRV